MKITAIPFGTTDWAQIDATEHVGESGIATWRTRQFGDIRVRMVQYSADGLLRGVMATLGFRLGQVHRIMGWLG